MFSLLNLFSILSLVQVTQIFLEGELLLGGEESGGIGVRNHIPERGGTVAGLLFLDSLATRSVPLSRLVAEIRDFLGPHCYQRLDFSLTPEVNENYQALAQNPPERIGRFRVSAVENLDGIKFWLGEHGWVFVRALGTEPLLQVYAESNNLRKTKEFLRNARKILLERKG